MKKSRDLILFSQIRNGNIGSFEELFNTYYEDLVLFAYKFLFDMDESQDLVQNLFFNIWETRKQIYITRSVKGYLYKSVKNRSLTRLKKRNLYDQFDILSINAIITTEDDIEETDILADKIKKIASSLPPKMSDIFLKKALGGYTIKEIAGELDISVNTVKTQLQRARDNIREELKKQI